MPQCEMIKADGTRWRSAPIVGRRYCYFHDDDPQTMRSRAKAASKGGRRAHSDDGLCSWVNRPVVTMGDLKTALNELLNAGFSGKLSTARLSSLASVANSLGKVIEQSDLEERIEALELKAKEMKG